MNSTTQFLQVRTGPKLKRRPSSTSSDDSSDDDLPNINWNKNPRLEDPTTKEEWIKRKCPVIKNSGAAVDLADNIMDNDTKGFFHSEIKWHTPGDHREALKALSEQMKGLLVPISAPDPTKFKAGFNLWEYPHVLMIPECVEAIKAHLRKEGLL